MSDCSDLQSQLNSISAKLDRLNADRANCCNEIDRLKGEIIRLNQLVSAARANADNALSQINPLRTKAAQAYDLGLSNQGEIGNLGAELAALAASAAAAIALARAAMAWIGGIGASLAGLIPFIPAIVAGIGALAAAMATIAAIQSRLDAIEGYADSIAVAAANAGSTAIAALGVGSKAERLAIAAQVAAANAQEFANRAWQRASLALDRGFLAQESADIANREIRWIKQVLQSVQVALADVRVLAGGAKVTADKAIAIAQPIPGQIEDLRRRLGAIAPPGTGTGAGTGTATTSQVNTAQATATAAAAGVAATNGAIGAIRTQIAQLQTSVFGTVIDLKPSAPGVYDTPVYPPDAPIVQVKQNTQKLIELEKRLNNENNKQNNNNNENKRAIAILTNLQQQCCNKKQEMQLTTITVPQFIKCGENGDPPTISAVTIQVPKGQESATKLQFAQNTQIMVNQCKECDAVATVPEWWQKRPEYDRPQIIYVFRERREDGSIGSSSYPLTIPHPSKSTINSPPKIQDYEKGNTEGILTLKDNSKIILHCKDHQTAQQLIDEILPLIAEEYREGYSFKIGSRGGSTKFSEIKVTARFADYYQEGAKGGVSNRKRTKFT
jgi:hypothetical protein